jgi:3-isopropylmalate dehydratase small subunit
VSGPDGQVDHFEVADFSRKCLLQGLDEIELIFMKADKLAAYAQTKMIERS